MADFLGGGDTRVINQLQSINQGGQGGLAELLKKLGASASSFEPTITKAGTSQNDAVDQFINSLIQPNLGSVADRLSTPIAGAAPTNLGLIQDRLLPTISQGGPPGGGVLPGGGLPIGGLPGGGHFGGFGGAVSGGLLGSLPDLPLPPIFSRKLF